MHDTHTHEHHEHDGSLSPSEILEAEHRVIERMLDAMEREAQRLTDGDTPAPWIFSDTSDFIADFADACHHAKEERRMFPMLETAGMPADHGPMYWLIQDHKRGRELNRLMRAAAGRLFAGDESARAELIGEINDYVKLLRIHIKKEDNAFFPMADRMLDEAHQRQLADEFDEVEREETGEGVHEKYLGVLERVEREMGL